MINKNFECGIGEPNNTKLRVSFFIVRPSSGALRQQVAGEIFHGEVTVEGLNGSVNAAFFMHLRGDGTSTFARFGSETELNAS